MSSFRDGQPTGFTKSRLAGTAILGGRAAVAGFTNKHLNTVRRYCVPIACDVNTRADLYDLDAAVGQFKAMNETRCCVPDASGDPCGSTIMRNAPLPICAVHAATVSEFYAKQDVIELARAAVLADQSEMGLRLPSGEPRASVVYYVQVGALVKIGTTLDVAQRLRDYPPNARLLATEPGGYTTERKRLRQFNEYLVGGREWFDPGERLRVHIEKLMAAAGVAA